jgi:hypothetical protein
MYGFELLKTWISDLGYDLEIILDKTDEKIDIELVDQ